MHLAAVHVHANLGSTHINVAIDDFAAAIHHRMVTAHEDDTVLGGELHYMIQIHPLADEAASITRHDLRWRGIGFSLDNRVHGLIQVKDISPNLTM